MTAAGAASTSLAGHAARLSAQADQVALCLDFDGTLSPIVDDPEAARPLAGVVELLEPLAARFAAVALISGRPADYLATYAAAPGVRYLGLYGLQEIRDGQVRVDPRLEAGRPAVEAAAQDLRDHPAVRDSGAFLEDKRYAVAVPHPPGRRPQPLGRADRPGRPPDRRPPRPGGGPGQAGLGAAPGRPQRQG
jgi:trehalose 6-phosphate phosphatase